MKHVHLPAFALLAALLPLGCTQRAQVIVEVSADPAVQERTDFAHLHLYVRTAGTITNDTPIAQDQTIPRPMRWPFRIVLTPSGDNFFSTPSERYEVIVGAHRVHPGDPPERSLVNASIVTSRARSGYVRGETRVLQLRLEEGCIGQVCDAGSTCRSARCELVQTIDPGTLPTLSTYQTDAGPADAYLAPGTDAFGLDAWTPDAWTPDRPDAAIDAFVGPVDAGIDAFVEPPDAHVPMGTDANLPDAYAPDAYAPDAFMPSGRFSSITPLPASGALFNTGWSVAISNTNMIAVGAPGVADYLYDATRPLAAPRVFSYPMAAVCGQSAAINSAGTIAAFGCPSVPSPQPPGGVIWEGPTWSPTRVELGLNYGLSVAMDASGTLLAFGGDEDITLRTSTSSVGNVVVGVTVSTLVLSDDGTLLVAGVQNASFVDEVRTFTVAGTSITSTGAAVENRGRVVALSGNGMTLVVGEILQHRASVYRRSGAGWGSPIATLTGPAASGFGASVAVNRDGTRIAVGATASSSACSGVCSLNCEIACAPSAAGGGAVYVYDGSGTLQHYIRPPTPADGGNFGYSVALNRAGNRLVIGEPSRIGGGAVYLVE